MTLRCAASGPAAGGASTSGMGALGNAPKALFSWAGGRGWAAAAGSGFFSGAISGAGTSTKGGGTGTAISRREAIGTICARAGGFGAAASGGAGWAASGRGWLASSTGFEGVSSEDRKGNSRWLASPRTAPSSQMKMPAVLALVANGRISSATWRGSAKRALKRARSSASSASPFRVWLRKKPATTRPPAARRCSMARSKPSHVGIRQPVQRAAAVVARDQFVIFDRDRRRISRRDVPQQQPADFRSARMQRAETLHRFVFQPVDQREGDSHRYRFLRNRPSVRERRGRLRLETFSTHSGLSHAMASVGSSPSGRSRSTIILLDFFRSRLVFFC